MIVVRERDCAGLPPAALREILNLPDDVLIVVVHTLDDDGPEPEAPGLPQQARQNAPAGVVVRGPVEERPAFSLRTIQSRSTDCDSAAGVNASSPKAPPENNPLDVSLPSRGSAVVMAGGAGGHIGVEHPAQADVHAAAGGQVHQHHGPVEQVHDLALREQVIEPRPHRLERGASWGDIQATAKAMRITATMGAGSGVTLTDAFGSTVYPDVPSAVAALNARWSHFNAIGTRLS